MAYLLDTHILLWWLDASPKLSKEVEAVIRSGVERIFVSSVSTWEIAIKRALGKLRVPDEIFGLFPRAGFLELPITIKHTQTLLQLPAHHQDPFDRLLIAQAQSEELVLITSDHLFQKYNVPVLLNRP